MTLAAVMPTLRPSIWPLSWAARSSQWSARADEALDTVSASAASSASVAARRVDLRNPGFNVIVMPLYAIEASAGGWRKGGGVFVPPGKQGGGGVLWRALGK